MFDFLFLLRLLYYIATIEASVGVLIAEKQSSIHSGAVWSVV